MAVIGGDGIGPEVLREGQKALAAVAQKDGRFSFEFTEFPWGCEYYLKTGKMMPEDGIETLSHFDAIYLGAVGYPGVPDHISLRDLLLRIRHDFDQYVNLRPVKLLKGAPCPLVGITEKISTWSLSGKTAKESTLVPELGSIRARRGKQSSRTGSSPALGQSASCAMPMNWLKGTPQPHQHQ